MYYERDYYREGEGYGRVKKYSVVSDALSDPWVGPIILGEKEWEEKRTKDEAVGSVLTTVLMIVLFGVLVYLIVMNYKVWNQ